MLPISRRNLLRAAAASALPLMGAGRAEASDVPPHRWIGSGPFTYVHDPSTLAGPRYLNDHTLVQVQDRWHLFSIVGASAPRGESPDSAAEIAFTHASAPTPYGPWTAHVDALTVDLSYFGEEHLWAPHVVEAGGRYWMFYAAGGEAGAAINLATSTDLFTWTREPSGPLFRGLAARDPMVVRIGGEWVMYYTELSKPGGRHVVAHRRSDDLLHWSEPGIVFTDASTDTTVSVTESPFVVERDDWYYLFIGPRGGYEGTDVLASRDPFHFDLDGYAGHVPGHAVEVVADGGNWYVSAAGWFRQGLYMAPLHWRDTPVPWQSPDNPVAGLDADGRLTVFALDAGDRSMLRRVQLDPNTDTWSAWEVFGGPAGAVPTLGRNTNGGLEVFSLAPGGANLHHRVQRPDGGWHDWEEFGGPAGAAPAVARDASGRLEVLALSPGGASVARRRQGAPGSLAWEPWEPGFGGAAGAPPVVAANADGRLEAFALSPGGSGIYHRWQEAPGGPWTAAWHPFGPAAGAAPRVARDGSGRLTVTAIGPSGVGTFHRRQSVPSGGWDDWLPLFGWSAAAPTLAVNADGRLEAFSLTPGGARLSHRRQVAPGGGWDSGAEFGEPGIRLAATPAAAIDPAGRTHVFAVTTEGRIRRRVQVRPSGGWGPWATFGDRPVAPVVSGSPAP
ncbi:Glycosyl hydrolase family 32 domain-containing protein [Streptomyces bingchenggensis BCW-1]|uniref:Glycosyl hydrolase family 32 domain-containing protein n=1 Tax=Streptomyces bingchenggensis (strain BCW-1) TaxID=749414 RepID=D7CDH7_STRBB|nr:family 43 glycosylhydrolase [Streptomyces bingchenggensis]ADI13019.1 Glycosyl hydrolase family 32 domain-containing protein [Streptomyces bingchenggensis BCW-1]